MKEVNDELKEASLAPAQPTESTDPPASTPPSTPVETPVEKKEKGSGQLSLFQVKKKK